MRCNCTLFPIRRVPAAAHLCTTWGTEGYSELLGLQHISNQTNECYTTSRKKEFVLFHCKMEFQIYAFLKMRFV